MLMVMVYSWTFVTQITSNTNAARGRTTSMSKR